MVSRVEIRGDREYGLIDAVNRTLSVDRSDGAPVTGSDNAPLVALSAPSPQLVGVRRVACLRDDPKGRFIYIDARDRVVLPLRAPNRSRPKVGRRQTAAAERVVAHVCASY